MDAGHFIAFGFLALLLQYLFASYGNLKSTALSFVVCAVLIITIEVIQPYVGRMASLGDVVNGFLGLIIFLSGRYIWLSSKRSYIKYLHALLGTLVFAAVVSAALSEWHAVWWRMQNFPMLGDFEENVELKLWRAQGEAAGIQTPVSLSSDYVVFGISALKIETAQGVWSGVRYAAGDKDWSAYNALIMDIYNPGTSFSIYLRIDDDRGSPDYPERFNRAIPLSNGWNNIEIALADVADGPQDSMLNMHAIHKLILFTSKEEIDRTFYLDHVHLQ